MSFSVWFWFHYVALTVLEVAMQTTLASDSQIHLSLLEIETYATTHRYKPKCKHYLEAHTISTMVHFPVD